MARARGRRRLLGALAAVVAAGIAVASLPPARARVKALPVLAEATDIAFPRPLAPDIDRSEITLDGVPGHLYTSGRPAPPLLLVPGATEAGLQDRRVTRAATAIARARRTVFVPDLALYERRFSDDDFNRLVLGARALERHDLARGRVSVLGFSYGGSYALIAAADPRLAGRLEQVAVFGAYFDLVGVVQAVTTGESIVGDRRMSWEGHPLAREILQEAGVDLVGSQHREALRAAFAGELDPAELPDAARAVYDLLTHDDPERTAELAERVPPNARLVLRRFSPATYADALRDPVVAIHSVDDPAVPYGEALRLQAALPDTRLVTVRIFEHVDLVPRSLRELLEVAPDLWWTWRFTGWVLAAQERWLR